MNIEFLKFLSKKRKSNEIEKRFGLNKGNNLITMFLVEEFIDEDKEGNYFLTENGKDELKRLRRKLYKRMEFWALIIAIISLSVSFYLGVKDLQYKENIEQLQIKQQTSQEADLIFNQAVELLKTSRNRIDIQKINCANVTNKTELFRNEDLLEKAEQSFMKLDFNSAISYLQKIEVCISCSECVESKAERREIENYRLALKFAYFWLLMIIVILIFLLILFLNLLKQKRRFN